MKASLVMIGLAVVGCFFGTSPRPAVVKKAPCCCQAGEDGLDQRAPAISSIAAPPDCPGGDSTELMEAFGRGFRALEQALASSDAAGVAEQADILAAASSRLRGLPEVPDWLIESHRLRVAALSAEIRRLAVPENLEVARHAFEDLRQTCVSCHARVERAPSFPSERGTVSGSIRVFASDGTPRETHGDVLVVLEGGTYGSRPRLPRKNPEISQQGRSFSPKVLPVLRHTTVEFPNDDTVFHNVFSLSASARFDLGIYDPGKSRSVTFDKTGVTPVYCNIHPEMRCTIVVVDTPYFTLTDRDGSFVVTGIPDGTYTLCTWNEYGAASSEQIQVIAGSSACYTTEIHETKTILSHLNKFGKPYRQKYK